MPHNKLADYQCPICKTFIRTQIPHECNYKICHKCKGTGHLGWRQVEECDWCHGTGEWTNIDG